MICLVLSNRTSGIKVLYHLSLNYEGKENFTVGGGGGFNANFIIWPVDKIWFFLKF